MQERGTKLTWEGELPMTVHFELGQQDRIVVAPGTVET
jgi:hypothetical protein